MIIVDGISIENDCRLCWY